MTPPPAPPPHPVSAFCGRVSRFRCVTMITVIPRSLTADNYRIFDWSRRVLLPVGSSRRNFPGSLIKDPPSPRALLAARKLALDEGLATARPTIQGDSIRLFSRGFVLSVSTLRGKSCKQGNSTFFSRRSAWHRLIPWNNRIPIRAVP